MQIHLITVVATICQLNMGSGTGTSDLIGSVITSAIKGVHSSVVKKLFFSALFPYPGGRKHVPVVSHPVTRVSPGRPGDPTASPAHQVQRTCAYRRGWSHVYQQPGHTHQVPRLQVRAHCHTRLGMMTDGTCSLLPVGPVSSASQHTGLSRDHSRIQTRRTRVREAKSAC